MTALILVLAANTAFNGFPVLGSILAQDNLPAAAVAQPWRLLGLQQRHRLAGIPGDRSRLHLRGQRHGLIQLYIVGVFIGFTLSQLGMIRRWTRLLSTEEDPTVRGQYTRRRS